MKKLKAFTLTEVIVTMIISGLLTGFLYWSYLTIQGYYFSIIDKQERAMEESEFFFQLKKDIDEASWVIESREGIKCLYDYKREVSYFGAVEGLKRTYEGNSAFLLKSRCTLKADKNSGDSIQSQLIARVRIYFGSTQDSIVLDKNYSPADLFNWTNFNEH
jgi:prepilin-type N-terminal cleavage/methylation domain-containing protein